MPSHLHESTPHGTYSRAHHLTTYYFYGIEICLSAALPLLQRASQRDNSYRYNTNMVFFWVELLKLIVTAFSCCTSRTMKDESSSSAFRHSICFSTAFLYFIRNNLQFVVLCHLPPTSFQLFINLWVLAAAVMTSHFLGKRQSVLQYMSVALLLLGCIQHFLLVTPESPVWALVSILSVAITSGMITVYSISCERSNQYTTLQRLFLFVYGTVINSLNWIRSLISGEKLTGEVNSEVVILISCATFSGLLIPAVLQSRGAMAHGAIGTLTILVTIVFDSVLFGNESSLLGSTTFVVVILAAQGYILASGPGALLFTQC